MKINIYDDQFRPVLKIESFFISCLWVEGYNTTEQFTLELRPLPIYKKSIKKDYFVTRDDRDTVMIIKEIKSDKDVFIVSGFEAKQCLADTAFLGTLAKNFVIDSEIAKMYNKSNKSLIEMSAGSLNDTCGHQISNKDFKEICEIATQSADVGFKVVRTPDKRLQAVFYKPPVNKNAVFAEAYGNLTVANVVEDNSKEKNVIIVLGEGKDASRRQIVADYTEAGEARKELIVDARDLRQEDGETTAEYENKLYARAAEKYLEHRPTYDVSVLPSGRDFGKIYELGDIITIRLTDYKTTVRARVVRFQELEQNNETTITVEVGQIRLRG